MKVSKQMCQNKWKYT